MSTPGAVHLRNVDMALAHIQASVENSLPLGRRKVSPNGREFFSNYFLPDGKKIRAAGKNAKQRFYAQVLVLGDRRPYTVEVLVHRERWQGEQNGVKVFERYATDESMAKVVVKRIQKELTKRQKGRDFIDEYRVF